MSSIISLVGRHNKLFLRNKTLVFFSLLSVFIVLGLYVIFLKKMQLDSLSALVEVTPALNVMISEWMLAGILSIMGMTTTLAVFGIYMRDKERKISADFLTTATTRYQLQLSYVISSFLIGFGITLSAFIASEVYLVVIGAELMSISKMLSVIGILALSTLLSSTINLFIVVFIKSETVFSTISTIVGSIIGFLCGVYVPMGSLPSFVQSIIHFFPVSHVSVLLRETMMHDSIVTVFNGNTEMANEYMLSLGILYKINDTILTQGHHLLFISLTIIILGAISLLIFIKKNK